MSSTTAAHPMPTLPADFSFTFDPSLSSWNHPVATWNSLNNKEYDGLVASTVVFHPVTNRILLIQRARHDSGALHWEIPGGAVECEDPTILHGAARELFEEAGLKARHIRRVLPSIGHDGQPGKEWTFVTRRGLTCCGWAFEVDVSLEDMEGGVKLHPDEHEDYVWASEKDVKAGAVGEKKIPLVSERVKMLILDAFKQRQLNGEMAA
ncbi:NUDIX domain-containing protein [Sarocladium implicatum]|nr:NUDIX domain-containing protein [Sarocladium implicatum]